MVTSRAAESARKNLDAKFATGELRAVADRPARGWIRAVRDALGMSSRQLAARLGQSQPGVVQLERSESHDRITLASLRRVAEALDCSLVYALVPNSTLDETVSTRARRLAGSDIAAVDQTMRLENQSLNAADVGRRIEEYAGRLVSEGRLWDDGAG